MRVPACFPIDILLPFKFFLYRACVLLSEKKNQKDSQDWIFQGTSQKIGQWAPRSCPRTLLQDKLAFQGCSLVQLLEQLWMYCCDLPVWGVLLSCCFFIALSRKWTAPLSQTQFCSSSPGSGTFHRAPSPGIWQLKLEPEEDRTKELGCFSRGIAASPGDGWLFCWYVAGTCKAAV